MTDRKTNDRFKNRFRKPRVGRTGRYTAHETDAHDAAEDPDSEEEESCEEESDLTTAFEREMDKLASVMKTCSLSPDILRSTRRWKANILRTSFLPERDAASFTRRHLSEGATNLHSQRPREKIEVPSKNRGKVRYSLPPGNSRQD